ncbi:MAG TPA: acetate--CoA ligase family protein, partial [Jatrophihabitans sp.]|nr:acetate--CoA ligase family protein [Jatrophihabitans sp.]
PRTRMVDGEAHIEFDLDPDESVAGAIAAREEAAAAASLRPLLAPRSVVVVGAGQRPGSVGHEVLRRLLDGGFAGEVHVVNPHRASVLGIPCRAAVQDLPDGVDLAVIAVPAQAVPDAVRACGERGVRAAVLLGAGFSEAGADGMRRQNEVLAIARRHGVRLVGPNCLGVANADPAVRLDATFGTAGARPGRIALFAQSGAFGAGLLDAAETAGVGIEQFVSIGNKIDVGGNDLLLAWSADPAVAVVGGYLESIGEPRRFRRIARRVTRSKPVLIVKSGRTDVGRQAGRSHTAAAASSDIAVDALFRAAGVVRVRSMRELLDAARLLADQPVPAGPRVAIVGNSGGPEVLAADAAIDAGLLVPEFDAGTAAALAALGVPTQNPVDLGAAVQPEQVRAVLDIVDRCATIDAVLTVFTDVAVSGADAVLDAVAGAGTGAKPYAAVRVGAAAATTDPPRRLPVFSFPEAAVAALAAAARYAALARVDDAPRRPEGLDAAVPRRIVAAALAERRQWLTSEETTRMLAAYGIPVCPQEIVGSEDAAVAAAEVFGYPVAAKLAGSGLHKSDLGGVRLHLGDEDALRRAVTDLRRLGDGRVLVQPMVSGGTELIVGAVHDPQCGPLVMVGAGGVLTDVLQDRAFALAPVNRAGAAEMIGRLRAAPLLDGYRGAPAVSRDAVADVIERIAALVDDRPEIAELDLNPLVGTGADLTVLDARIRVAEPPKHPDPLVRQLRGPNGAG